MVLSFREKENFNTENLIPCTKKTIVDKICKKDMNELKNICRSHFPCPFQKPNHIKCEVTSKEKKKHVFPSVVCDQDLGFGETKLDIENFNHGIQIASGWFVRQFENEYNPLHIHTGARMSCVGYLKLPKDIEKEWEEDYKDHHPANGHIQFAHGTSSGYNQTNFMVKPKVGDFYIFPAELFHCVYPFKTKGERRSFSVNFTFIEVPKETVDKQ